jgi:hypothetical protein
MKTKKKTPVEVHVGRAYRAVVRGKVAIVTVKAPHADGGWDVEVISTGSRHRVSSAAGFLCECDQNGKPVEAQAKAGEKKAPAAKAAATKADKKKRTGGLDAAMKVMAEAGKPMNTADIVKVALEKGYWSTNGKTPSATIYAAIIREIAIKGQASRFRKVARGKFALKA